jgi:hypothetical protein
LARQAIGHFSLGEENFRLIGIFAFFINDLTIPLVVRKAPSLPYVLSDQAWASLVFF